MVFVLSWFSFALSCFWSWIWFCINYWLKRIMKNWIQQIIFCRLVMVLLLILRWFLIDIIRKGIIAPRQQKQKNNAKIVGKIRWYLMTCQRIMINIFFDRDNDKSWEKRMIIIWKWKHFIFKLIGRIQKIKRFIKKT